MRWRSLTRVLRGDALIIVRSTRVVLPDGERAASIHITDDGRIARVASYEEASRGADLIDAGDLVVSPGIVDTHVHVNEPGRTEWEGFDTATRAAAAGGVTTIVDMPLNSIPATTTAAALDAKRAAAHGRVHVDVAFWGGVVPGNAADLDPLADAGVRGFKCFLTPSGVDEFPHVGERDVLEAMPILSRRRLPLLVHAEDPARLRSPEPERASARQAHSAHPTYLTHPTPFAYATYLASRPPLAEVEAVRLISRLAGESGVHVHIVHVACAEAVDEIMRAKSAGVTITAETCPHYLTFAAEEIPDGATEYKCAPPIREAKHRDALWAGLRRGVLDLVATDHSPAPPLMKAPGDFMRAWGGISSLELSLGAVWRASEASAASEKPRPHDLARWLSDAPARLAGLDGRKGRIAAGLDADLMIWDPDAERPVEPSALQQRHKLTPYAGRTLRGVVKTTLLRGERVWEDGSLVAERRGRLL